MTGNCHVRCGVGENSEIISKSYLSLLLVFRFIEQEVINAREANKSGKNLRTLIIADEAHLFIDAKFPIALDFFFSMSKRIRKYNGSFIPATQNIADWNANEELRSKTSAILKNSQYTFIFKLSAPDMKDVLDVYKAGDSFNADEQRMIISAVTGQVFFIGSTELRTNVKITTGEYIKSLFEDKTGENYNKAYITIMLKMDCLTKTEKGLSTARFIGTLSRKARGTIVTG